jgi:hypothetical protein
MKDIEKTPPKPESGLKERMQDVYFEVSPPSERPRLRNPKKGSERH